MADARLLGYCTAGLDSNRYTRALERLDGDDHQVVSFDRRAMGAFVIGEIIVVEDGEYGVRCFTYTDGGIVPVDAI